VGKAYDGEQGILARLESLASLQAVSYHAIGTTHENRQIGAMKFGPWGDPPGQVPTLVIAGTYHAREWISTVVAQDLIEALAEAFTQQSGDLYQALENATVAVVPVVNPDGYEYTLSTDRMWRPNRNLTSCEYGVDPNRNHNPAALWQSKPCTDETFPGPAPASDAEAQAIEDLLEGRAISGLKPVAFISYHSHGNLLLYPEGYSVAGAMACSLNGTAEDDLGRAWLRHAVERLRQRDGPAADIARGVFRAFENRRVDLDADAIAPIRRLLDDHLTPAPKDHCAGPSICDILNRAGPNRRPEPSPALRI
jgi:hypothetical protein